MSLVCVGDLMVESIFKVPGIPKPEQTVIVDNVPRDVGGSAFNVCWYLRKLGRPIRLIGTYGHNQDAAVKSALRHARLDMSGLIPIKGNTDFLIAFSSGAGYASFYLRTTLPAKIGRTILSRCRGGKRFILIGSRHPMLRGVFRQLARKAGTEVLAFNPSYAVTEYAADEINDLLKLARVVVFNEEEGFYVNNLLGGRNLNDLAKHIPGILVVTLGARGVRVYNNIDVIKIDSFTHKEVDPLGAGDAFLGGFLHMLLKGASTRDAAHFGSALAAFVVESSSVRIDLSEAEIRRRFRVRQ